MDVDVVSNQIISQTLMKMKDLCDIDSIQLNFYNKNINVDEIDLPNALKLRQLWLDIAKFSFYGFHDFNFVTQLYMPDRDSPIFHTAMINMGCQLKNKQWKFEKLPTLDTVTENIYKYHFYNFIVIAKTKKLEANVPGANNAKKSLFAVVLGAAANINREPPQEAARVANQIKCPKCHCIKDNDNLHCNKCTEADQVAKKRPCDMCSFLNEMDALNCAACETIMVERPLDKDVPKKKAPIGWTCSQCQCLNGFRQLVCKACHKEGPHLNKRPCHKCTFLNDSQAAICEVCHCNIVQPKETVFKDVRLMIGAILGWSPRRRAHPVIDVVERWKCPVCLLKNDYKNLACRQCLSEGPHAQKWRCAKCHFLNEINATACETCQSPNDAFPR